MKSHAGKKVLQNCHLATMRANGEPYGSLLDGAIAIDGGEIAWVGAQTEKPAQYESWPIQDLGGQWVLPAFVDCHTHLVYAGNRVDEFEQRLNGASYQEIAKAGGGIVSTVTATRYADTQELLQQSLPRLQQMMSCGTGTVEIKSGYGLTVQDEIKMLETARQLGVQTGVNVRTSFLGAHAVPAEFAGRADDYIELVVSEMLPEIARLGLADSVDAFCEGIGFSLIQTKKVLDKAIELGLPIRLHAEQLSNLHGAQMAAQMGALSCDHLEHLDRAGAKAMAKAGTVGVLLPGAFYFLGETQKPPIAVLREEGVDMAIASDCNPGSSPTTSLLLMMSMAVQFFGLTPQETLIGVTRNAAKALRMEDKLGQISAGFAADLVAWNIHSPAELVYGFGNCPMNERV